MDYQMGMMKGMMSMMGQDKGQGGYGKDGYGKGGTSWYSDTGKGFKGGSKGEGKPRGACWRFQQGDCYYGNNCTFAHYDAQGKLLNPIAGKGESLTQTQSIVNAVTSAVNDNAGRVISNIKKVEEKKTLTETIKGLVEGPQGKIFDFSGIKDSAKGVCYLLYEPATFGAMLLEKDDEDSLMWRATVCSSAVYEAITVLLRYLHPKAKQGGKFLGEKYVTTLIYKFIDNLRENGIEPVPVPQNDDDEDKTAPKSEGSDIDKVLQGLLGFMETQATKFERTLESHEKTLAGTLALVATSHAGSPLTDPVAQMQNPFSRGRQSVSSNASFCFGSESSQHQNAMSSLNSNADTPMNDSTHSTMVPFGVVNAAKEKLAAKFGAVMQPSPSMEPEKNELAKMKKEHEESIMKMQMQMQQREEQMKKEVTEKMQKHMQEREEEMKKEAMTTMMQADVKYRSMEDRVKQMELASTEHGTQKEQVHANQMQAIREQKERLEQTLIQRTKEEEEKLSIAMNEAAKQAQLAQSLVNEGRATLLEQKRLADLRVQEVEQNAQKAVEEARVEAEAAKLEAANNMKKIAEEANNTNSNSSAQDSIQAAINELARQEDKVNSALPRIGPHRIVKLVDNKMLSGVDPSYLGPYVDTCPKDASSLIIIDNDNLIKWMSDSGTQMLAKAVPYLPQCNMFWKGYQKPAQRLIAVMMTWNVSYRAKWQRESMTSVFALVLAKNVAKIMEIEVPSSQTKMQNAAIALAEQLDIAAATPLLLQNNQVPILPGGRMVPTPLGTPNRPTSRGRARSISRSARRKGTQNAKTQYYDLEETDVDLGEYIPDNEFLMRREIAHDDPTDT